MQNYPGDSMTSAKMNHIPLNSAYLCQDCEAVGNSAMQCPACASRVLLSLAGVFGRNEATAQTDLFLVPAPEQRLCRFSNMRRWQPTPPLSSEPFRADSKALRAL